MKKRDKNVANQLFFYKFGVKIQKLYFNAPLKKFPVYKKSKILLVPAANNTNNYVFLMALELINFATIINESICTINKSNFMSLDLYFFFLLRVGCPN